MNTFSFSNFLLFFSFNHNLKVFLIFLLSKYIWFQFLLRNNLSENSRRLLEFMFIFNSLPLFTSSVASSFNPCTISKLMRTFFNNHIRKRFFNMGYTIKIHPFLDLPEESFLSYINDSDSGWVITISTQWSHNNNWSLEITLDLNIMPFFSCLSRWNSTELNNSSRSFRIFWSIKNFNLLFIKFDSITP